MWSLWLLYSYSTRFRGDQKPNRCCNYIELLTTLQCRDSVQNQIDEEQVARASLLPGQPRSKSFRDLPMPAELQGPFSRCRRHPPKQLGGATGSSLVAQLTDLETQLLVGGAKVFWPAPARNRKVVARYQRKKASVLLAARMSYLNPLTSSNPHPPSFVRLLCITSSRVVTTARPASLPVCPSLR